jgi:hypothetical protein
LLSFLANIARSWTAGHGRLDVDDRHAHDRVDAANRRPAMHVVAAPS